MFGLFTFKTDLPHLESEIERTKLGILILACLSSLPVITQTLAWPLVLIFCAVIALGYFTGAQRLIIKLIIIIATFAALYIFRPSDQQGFFSAAIALLVALKSLELHTIRDGQFLLHTALLALFSGALMLPTAWMSGIVISGTAGVLLGHFLLLNPDITFSWQRLLRLLTRVGKISVIALPVIVLLFYIFPRVGGNFFQLGLVASQTSGLSDSLKPGDLSSVALGDTTRFRVFSTPPAQNTYYRVYSLDSYDGISWSINRPLITNPIDIDATTSQLEIEMEPQGQIWRPLPEWASVSSGTFLYSNTFGEQDPLASVWRRSFLLANEPKLNSAPLTAEMHSHLISLPDSDPKTREWLLQFSDKPLSVVINSLRTLFSQDFIYTLQPPPPPPSNFIDELLFNTQKGYCGHYANATAYILRGLGYPSRVVIGFQGGEYNPIGNYIEVSDADAHAWVEVFDQNTWIRIDPTAWLAPERIQSGGSLLRNALFSGVNAQTTIDPKALAGVASFWRSLQQRLDYLQRLYVLWVVDFDRDRQTRLLDSLKQYSVWLLLGLCILFASIRWLKTRDQDRALKALDRYLQKTYTIKRKPFETPQHYANVFPELEEFAKQWSAKHYGNGDISQRDLIQILNDCQAHR